MSGAGVRWEDLKVTMQLNSVEAIKNAVQFNLGAAFLRQGPLIFRPG